MTETLLSPYNNIFHSHYCKIKKLQTPILPLSLKPSSCRPLPRGVRMDSSTTTTSNTNVNHSRHHHKDKVVIIIGATGCGKTSLSINIATRFSPGQSEIINSDKIQVYKGLDITTNKIPLPDRRGVPHHLLGEFAARDVDFTSSGFRFSGGLAVDDIVSRHKLPIVVGGSNSFIYSLVVDQFDPGSDVFRSDGTVISTEFRYDCCFIWVDVALPVLCDYLCKRVDEMLDSGMFDELCEFYNSGGFGPLESAGWTAGLRKAIGVPEFHRYFREYGSSNRKEEWDQVQLGAYEDAVKEIKENTCQLAKRQIGKILRLRGAGWDLQRVDATEAFREMMRDETTSDFCGCGSRKERKKKRKKRGMEVWERDVVSPSVKVVTQFLEK